MAEIASKKGNRLTWFILIAMLAGIATGYFLNTNYSVGAPSSLDKILQSFSLLADIFLRLIKMIVAPLVFCTLVVGVAKQGSVQTVGRIGGKTLLWFLCGTLVSLTLGMALINFFQPGVVMGLPLPEAVAANAPQASLTLKDFISHIFPTSIFEAMAKTKYCKW